MYKKVSKGIILMLVAVCDFDSAVVGATELARAVKRESPKHRPEYAQPRAICRWSFAAHVEQQYRSGSPGIC